MKTLLQLFFILACGLILARETVTGKVVGVSDGDTIKILTADRQEIKIRLYGIDTPEKAQDYGQKAKQFTSDAVFGKTVRVEIIDRDRYGRSVALVFPDNGPTLNERLVTAGFAWRYDRYCREEPLCRTLETEQATARAAKKGLWADPTPTPPWDWRKEKKKKAQSQQPEPDLIDEINQRHDDVQKKLLREAIEDKQAERSSI